MDDTKKSSYFSCASRSPLFQSLSIPRKLSTEQLIFTQALAHGDATRIIVVVGTPSSSTKAESEKEELVAFTFPSFAAIFHPSSVLPSRKLAQPLATPSVPVAAATAAATATSLRHLLSAAIFRIRYLRSQLQISRIPRTEVPLDRTLSDTTRLPFPTRSPLVSRRPTRPPSDLSFPLSLPLLPCLSLYVSISLSPLAPSFSTLRFPSTGVGVRPLSLDEIPPIASMQAAASASPKWIDPSICS